MKRYRIKKSEKRKNADFFKEVLEGVLFSVTLYGTLALALALSA